MQRRLREPDWVAIRQVARSRSPIDDLLWMIEPAIGDEEARLRTGNSGRHRIAARLQDFSRTAVLPYWRRIRVYLESERDNRGRIATTGGFGTLLSTLHPSLCWRAPVLEVQGVGSGDVFLAGRGIVLTPSLFLHNRVMVLSETRREEGRPTLIFPAALDPGTSAAIWDDNGADREVLGALVGRTRAAVLHELTESCSTGELAKRLGISSAGASQHTSVLREAGLITTRRNRNMVLHTVTTLGMALIERGSLEVGDPSLAPLCA